MKSNISFSLGPGTFGLLSKKALPNSISRNLTPVLSFIVLVCAFRYTIHFNRSTLWEENRKTDVKLGPNICKFNMLSLFPWTGQVERAVTNWDIVFFPITGVQVWGKDVLAFSSRRFPPASSHFSRSFYSSLALHTFVQIHKVSNHFKDNQGRHYFPLFQII